MSMLSSSEMGVRPAKLPSSCCQLDSTWNTSVRSSSSDRLTGEPEHLLLGAGVRTESRLASPFTCDSSIPSSEEEEEEGDVTIRVADTWSDRMGMPALALLISPVRSLAS